MADRRKLLIVEDDRPVRELIETIVEEAGYGTIPAANGREALAILERRHCDLIVSDIRMPEMNGLELLAALKKRSEQAAKPPASAIVLAGSHDVEIVVQAMQLGALNYVVKPFDSSTLLATIEAAVEQSRQLTKVWLENQDRQHLLELQGMELAHLSRQLEAISGSSRAVAANRPAAVLGTATQQFAPKNVSDMARSPEEADALGAPVFEIPVQLGFGNVGTAKLDAKIRRVNSGFFVLSSGIALERGKRLKVFYRERPIDSEVVYCNRHSDGSFRIGLVMRDGQYGSFRAEQRIPVNMATTVTVAGKNAPVAATIIDISPSGIGFRSSEPIAIGDIACLDLGAGLAFGEVRRCEKSGADYHLGLRIEQCLVCEGGEPHEKPTFFQAARALLPIRKKH